MKKRDKQILALRTAYLSGIFSLIISSVMLLNYWQLVTTDPLESEAIQVFFENYMDDTSNEDLKLELRSLDLMARKAYFNNVWQIRSGAYLLIGGIVILVFALRVYYSSKAKIVEPDAKDTSLDIELFISRKWILYAISIVFVLTLIASYLSVDHLSDSYAITATLDQEDKIPVQQITPRQDDELSQVSPALNEEGETDISGTEQETSDDTGLPAEQEQDASLGDDPVTESEMSATPRVAEAPGNSDILNNFPAFRGPFGLGISNHKNIPTDWDGSTGSNILWKSPVPLDGYSSPVLWNNSIFITGADETNQSVFCFNAQSGQLEWEHKVTGIVRPQGVVDPTEDTGFAAPSATTDGRYVFAIFATGDLVCTDLDGNKVWAKNMGVPDNHYGHSSSLIVWKNLLYIQFDTNEAGKVIALDVHTGDLVWETIRTSKISWATPILPEMGDHYELILASSPFVSAYDPDSGKELWSLDCLSGEVGASPSFYNGVIFAANEYAKLVALKPGNPPTILWETNEYLPEVSSPVAANDLLFVGTSYGVIVCYGIDTGEVIWEFDANRGFYASPIIIDDKVYFLDRGGKMYIFSIDKTLKLINDPELGESTVSSPAFSEGRIYIRGIDHLYCIGG